MKYCTCPYCDREFELTNASKDSMGWHTDCPRCGAKLDVDIEDYAVPQGTLVQFDGGLRGVVADFKDEYATELGEIVYLVNYRVGRTELSKRMRRCEFDLVEDWKLLKRTDYGIERVCHYPKNQEWSNAPCYNCCDRARCNADIFERLAKYEDTEMPPDTVAEYKKFEDELVQKGQSFRHILDLLEAEREGRLVILPVKEVYELAWDAGPECDLRCPVSIGNHGRCDMCEKGKVFAYKRTCKQEHISEIGRNVFFTKEEAEAEAEKINAMYEEEERCTD